MAGSLGQYRTQDGRNAVVSNASSGGQTVIADLQANDGKRVTYKIANTTLERGADGSYSFFGIAQAVNTNGAASCKGTIRTRNSVHLLDVQCTDGLTAQRYQFVGVR
jgi:hypothetical protein